MPYYDRVDRYLGVSGHPEGLLQMPDGQFQRAIQLTSSEMHLRQTLKGMNRMLTPYRAGAQAPLGADVFINLSVPSSQVSEAKLCRKLDPARTPSSGDVAKSGTVEACIRIVPLGRVYDTKALGAKLEERAFGDVKIAEHRRI